MAYLSLAEIARLDLWATRPELLSKLTQLMHEVERQLQLRTFVRPYGGYRGPNVQAQLEKWRNEADAKDGIIGGGRDFYAVNPAGTSHHEYGAAFDLGILEPAKRTDANYRAIAELSKKIGLVPGYYFPKRDEFHHQLAEPLSVARFRWDAMMKRRAAIATVAVVVIGVAIGLTFFFPASSALAVGA